MQSAKARDGGGMILEGDTRLGRYRIEIDAAGSVVVDDVKVNTPKQQASWVHPSKRKGLGDVVAAGIKVATLGMVKPCGPCEKRKKKLNELGRRITPIYSD